MTSVLFNMRSMMTRTFKNNFSSLYKDNTRYRLKCTNPNAVNQLSLEEREHAHSVKYSDIFGPMELQWKVVKVMIRMLEIWENLLQKDGLPVGENTGPNFAITPL